MKELESATGAFRSELRSYIAAGAGLAGEDAGETGLVEGGDVFEDDEEGPGWTTDFFSGSCEGSSATPPVTLPNLLTPRSPHPRCDRRPDHPPPRFRYGDAFNGVALMRKGNAAVAAASFPTTMSILRDLDFGVGGNRLVFFGRQRAGSGIPPHSDCCNYLMTGHLGIHVPDGGGGGGAAQAEEAEGTVGMNVAGKRVQWAEGKLAVIQNAYPHHTWNKTAHDRVVLYFDFWHPDLSLDERRALEIFSALKLETEAAEGQEGGGPKAPPPGMPLVDDPKLLELLRRFG